MIILVAGEALIAFLTITKADVPLDWAVAGFLLARLVTAIFFWAIARTDTDERS